MNIPEAKRFLGQNCSVTWNDRHGNEVIKTLHLHDVTFVPLYGAYIIGDTEDVCLDRVKQITVV